MPDNDIRFSREEVIKEEAEGNFRIVNQLFTSVEYKHASIVRLTYSSSKFLIAFGDFIPNPSEKDSVVLRPLVGVSMPHEMARELIGYLQRQIDAIDAAKTESADPKEQNAKPAS